jgi:hypothetical protein
MTIFKSVFDYLKVGKTDDLLVFQGKGILNGFNYFAKTDVYKHTCVRGEDIYLRAYRAKKPCSMKQSHFDQKVMLLTKKEFSQLEVY